MSKLTKALTAAAGNAGGDNLYVEDVFSTYLYDGNSSSPITINNGIDFAGEGGLFWNRDRNTGYTGSVLLDTERGTLQTLATDQTSGNVSISSNKNVTYNSNGITIQAASSTATGVLNFSNYSLCSWSFRKAEKWLDIVTYTGNGSDQDISHNLGSTPGFVIIKATSTTGNWSCWHSALNASSRNYILLNSTSRDGGNTVRDVNSSTFEVYGNYPDEGSNGVSYVAYVFASDAGGFGGNGSENIIKCGSYTGTSSLNSISCGFEPQFVLVKCSSHNNTRWSMFDAMRGVATGSSATTGDDERLTANSSDAESAFPMINFTATGFDVQNQYADVNENGRTYIYIAIRRPMKTPEAGTEVFAMDTAGGTAPTPPLYTSGFPVDFFWWRKTDEVYNNIFESRLTGQGELHANSTDAEGTDAQLYWDTMTGARTESYTAANRQAWMFKRATGFMDVVCYSGNASEGYQVNHNLGVIPELIIIKRRNNASAEGWFVGIEFSATNFTQAKLNVSNTAVNSLAYTSSSIFKAQPTTTNFTLGNYQDVNGSSSDTYIAYLFATLAGVSKVGSYTGTGADLNVDCGFSAGARFILIKRTDSTGGWHVWDSSRGISASTDSYLLLNSTAAEVTNTDYVDPLASGFTVTSSAPAALNASGGSYIFLAIA